MAVLLPGPDAQRDIFERRFFAENNQDVLQLNIAFQCIRAQSGFRFFLHGEYFGNALVRRRCARDHAAHETDR